MTLLRHVQLKARNGSLIHGLIGLGGDIAVEDIGYEERGAISIAIFSHSGIPRAIDLAVAPGCRDLTSAIQDDQAAGFGVSKLAIASWQAADDYPAAFEFDQRGCQADPIGAGLLRQLREDALLSIGRDLHNRCAGTLIVLAVVKIADQDISLNQFAGALLNYRCAVRVDIAVARNG